jgi:hypothetical protein
MRATFRRQHRQSGGDPSLQAAAALTLAASDIARVVADGLSRTSTGRPAIKAEVVASGHGASLVVTARHRELGAAIEQARGSIARILHSAWLTTGQGVHHSGGLPDGH